MPNITILPTITTATNETTFVIVDNRLTRRMSYSNLKIQLSRDLKAEGFQGPTGSTGTNGTNGINGIGVPSGGNTGQVLAKASQTNFTTTWITLAAVSTTGNYSSLIGIPAAYTATSIDSFIDVDTSTVPPTNGQALLWSSGNNKWQPASVGAGIGLSTRTTAVGSSGLSLSPGQTSNSQIVGFKSYLLSKVATNYPAWVRIYTDAASRTNDSTRTEGNDPLPGSGVIAEVITTAGYLTQLITPGVIGFNNDTVTTSTIYVAVTNKDSTSRTISTTLSILQLEA
jgi:hypothetical protein